jgi:adenylate cyclase
MKLERKLFLVLGILILCVIALLLLFSDFIFLSDLKRTKMLFFAGIALFSFFTLALMWWIIRGITKPLSDLSNAAERIKEGKFEEIRLPKTHEKQDEISSLTRAFETMIEGLKEREKIRSVLNKVVSKDIADEILKSHIQLGGEDREITILFADIRNFTGMIQPLTPQETIMILNAFMTKMTRVIEGEGGIIDKYIGDEIMALYGAPISYPDHALKALASAKIMIETLKLWNIERERQGQFRIEMGVGIHTGIVVAGNMGAEDRLNYTVLGSSVNLASRLCQAAKPGQILISEYTWDAPDVQESFYVNALPPIQVKGFSQPINIFEIVGFKWENE